MERDVVIAHELDWFGRSFADLAGFVEDLLNDVFEVIERAIGRVSRRRSIEATTEPDDRVLKFPVNGTNSVDVVIEAMKEGTHHLRRLMISYSPRLRQGEHVERVKKREGEVLKQR